VLVLASEPRSSAAMPEEAGAERDKRPVRIRKPRRKDGEGSP